ncbi:two-component system regulatory protein YycI [Robertmurraya massiliosenegalensis]|uniref:two-component system regulatory protein YycI n=1 Tax=Robertmurraya massiliosenegalensis TaxID=1287657 RepID=UPI00030DDDBF|nr:two-component system regulatory protein YycI [Robertmurraya massiliosenegalensis]
MDWSKLKTIFIVTFLVLNIYLLSEFYKKYESSQYPYLSETSFENKLKTEEIEYNELPKNIKKDRYISATPKKFLKDELVELTETILQGQQITIKNETTIESEFDEPIQLKEDFTSEDLVPILKNHVFQGERYRFWKLNPLEQTITYYQQQQEKMLYRNINGELTIFFNDNDEIIGYRQTLLENFEEFSEDENILQPMKAIEFLYDNGELPFGSKITKVELGYYTLVHLTSSQVLTPVWRFVINGEEDLFVNAFEGQIIQLNNEDKKIVE